MRRRVLAAAGLLAVLVLFSVVLAQTGQFDLPWYSVDGGGGASAGGDFDLRAAVGQPDSGLLAGGDYTVSGGFLSIPLGSDNEPELVFLPLLLKNG